ncbi:MAG TPA: tRNA glutamyl-Q(34) synthetase GluQRS [Aeromonadales bacterium]|nr:tRNA glutamyl-Q(34) synthetase GluQRS [Aeromonadales bacterium]
MTQNSYIGRFAPSPSGPLHFGSLVAAVASYLQARSNQGKWLVRIEDIDPPRESKGAADSILRTLENFHLCWDDNVIYQSEHMDRYQQCLHQLYQQQQTYFCTCSRKAIKKVSPFYQGHCRHQRKQPSKDFSIRFYNPEPLTQFYDEHAGKLLFPLESFEHDFILKRKDGLFAYQLAVVVDDMDEAITEVVRGADLLDSTPRQIQLFQSFARTAPRYLHLPLVLGKDGDKLSKLTHAEPVDNAPANQQLFKALQFLQQSPPATLQKAPVNELLQWALSHWQPGLIPSIKSYR